MNCTGCGAALPPGANFCPGCGRRAGDAPTAAVPALGHLERLIPRQYLDQLVAARGRPGGERRVVTIVFFDITGSTAMAERLDPEDVMEIMNGAFEVLIEPIYRYEGTLARLMGDAVLAFFGAPIAHEDDPARACQAALDVLTRARGYAARLERERGIGGFDVRVGINTGLVAVGEVGADLRVEYTAMGDAVNLAARMESAAEPGTVLITSDTHERITHLFETDDLGEIRVKGKAEPVHVYRLLRPRPTNSVHHDAAPATPLFGCDAGLSELSAILQLPARGQGAGVDVVGDAGAGKSRLIAEAVRSSPGVQCIQGRCLQYAANIGYWIAGEMLCGLMEVDRHRGPGEAGAVLLRAIPSRSQDDYPFLAHLLGLPLDAAARDAVMRLSEADRGHRLAAAYRGVVRERAARAPLVMVWDDLQWADPESLAIVTSLLEVCDRAPLVVVRSYRPGESGEIMPWPRVIRVAPLDAAASEQMMKSILRGLPMPPSLVKEVIAAADGNPFFLEQVACSLIEAADMVNSGWGLRALKVPTTLHGAVMARIDSLEAREKNTLQVASVIGRQFSREVLSSVAASETEGAVLDTSLQELELRDFVQSTSPAGAGEYAFQQAMTAEVAYNSLLKSRRVELHRRAGLAIEALFPDRHDELSPILAHHFDAAGDAAKAAEYTLRAARRARSLSSNREAIRRYRRVLELAEAGGAGGAGAVDVDAVREELGDVHVVVGNYAAALEAYEGVADVLAGPRGVTLARKKGQLFQKWGKIDDAAGCFESAERALRKPLDTTEAVLIYSGLGMVHCRRGRLDEAVALAARALKMAEESGQRRGLAQASNNLGIIHARSGAWEDAIACHERAQAIWEELGDDYGLAASLNNTGLALHGGGRAGEAQSAFERSLALFEKIGNRHGQACAYDNLGQVYIDRGDEELAMDNLKKAVTIMAEIAVDKSELVPEMWEIDGW